MISESRSSKRMFVISHTILVGSVVKKESVTSWTLDSTAVLSKSDTLFNESPIILGRKQIALQWHFIKIIRHIYYDLILEPQNRLVSAIGMGLELGHC